MYFLKLFLKSKIKRDHSYACLVGRTTIVTGSNTGKDFFILDVSFLVLLKILVHPVVN